MTAPAPVVRHLDRVLLAGEGVGCEGGLVEEVAVDDLIALAQRRRGIGSRGGEVAAVEIEAVAGAPLEAGFAVPAGEVAEHDRVTGLHLRDRCSDAFDDARTLVAEDARQGDGEVLIATHQIGVADPGTHDTHDEFVASRGFEL